MLSQRPSEREIPRGLDASLDKILGIAGRLVRRSRRFLQQAEMIVSMEKHLRHVSERRLGDMAADLKERFQRGRDQAEDRRRAFALVREVADRKVGMRPYPVQVAGALAIDNGDVRGVDAEIDDVA